jgi:hypothetical protein
MLATELNLSNGKRMSYSKLHSHKNPICLESTEAATLQMSSGASLILYLKLSTHIGVTETNEDNRNYYCV